MVPVNSGLLRPPFSSLLKLDMLILDLLSNRFVYLPDVARTASSRLVSSGSISRESWPEVAFHFRAKALRIYIQSSVHVVLPYDVLVAAIALAKN